MKTDMLDALGDDDLRAIAARCDALLKQHDTERKDKALADARALLEAVGLSLKDLNKGKSKNGKGPVYRLGHYHHPNNRALTWTGKGKKPGWVVALEAEGKAPAEATIDNQPPLKKAS